MTDFPDLKIKTIPIFPSNIIGGVGLTSTKTNGAVTLDYAWQEFGSISSIPTSPTSYILTYDIVQNAYVMVPSHLLGGAVAGIADAPIDGTQYGRQSGAWTPVTSTGSGGPSPSTTNPLQDGTAAPGTSLLYARGDHVHPTDPSIALKAPLISPALTGNPTSSATLTAPHDNDTSLATTAFVHAALGAVSGALPTASTSGYLLQTNGVGSNPTWNGFVQPGSSFTRTWQHKAADTVSILDFLNEATFVNGSITVSGTGTDCSSAFTAAWASGAGKRVIIPPGNYRIASNQNFTGTVTFDFMPGAVICPDAGVTITFINPVYAGVRRIFGNNGTIIGIRSVMPEWWGAVLGSDCYAAIQSAINCGQNSSGSVGEYRLTFQAGTYQLSSGLVFNFDNANWKVSGAGHMATNFVALSSISGSCFSLTSTTLHDFSFADFSINNQTSGVGASIGIAISVTAAYHYSTITNIQVSGFATNWYLGSPTRLIKFDRCSAWAANNTTNIANLHIEASANNFVGDCDFVSCQWVAVGTVGAGSPVVPLGTNVLLYSAASAGHITGLRFAANIFYAGLNGLTISVGGGAYCDDIWIMSCQFEGAVMDVASTHYNTQAITLGSSGSGSRIQDLHINQCYFAGFGWNYHIFALCSGGSGDGTTPNGMWTISGNFMNNGVAASVWINCTGGTYTGLTFANNTQRDCAHSADINTFINMYYVAANGNITGGSTTGNCLFNQGGGGDWGVYTGNNSCGQRVSGTNGIIANITHSTISGNL